MTAAAVPGSGPLPSPSSSIDSAAFALSGLSVSEGDGGADVAAPAAAAADGDVSSDDDEEEAQADDAGHDGSIAAAAASGGASAAADVRALASLVAVPRSDDVLLSAVLMLCPYSVALTAKYRVKLAPGPMKRGKAAQSALVSFSSQSKAAAGTVRERELIKCISDAEANLTMVGGVKVSVPTAAATALA